MTQLPEVVDVADQGELCRENLAWWCWNSKSNGTLQPVLYSSPDLGQTIVGLMALPATSAFLERVLEVRGVLRQAVNSSRRRGDSVLIVHPVGLNQTTFNWN